MTTSRAVEPADGPMKMAALQEGRRRDNVVDVPHCRLLPTSMSSSPFWGSFSPRCIECSFRISCYDSSLTISNVGFCVRKSIATHSSFSAIFPRLLLTCPPWGLVGALRLCTSVAEPLASMFSSPQNDRMVPSCATGSCCNVGLTMSKRHLLLCRRYLWTMFEEPRKRSAPPV